MCNENKSKNLDSGCGRWHYENITREKWEKIKELYKKLTGKELPGNEGIVEIHKPFYLKVYYKYDPDNLTGEVEILEKEMLLLCSIIKKIIDKFIDQLISGEIVELTGGCGRWHYDNITGDKWEKIKELFKKATGKDLPGNEGIVEIHNPFYLKVYYKYNPDNLTGEVEILEKPVVPFCSTIKKILDKIIDQLISGEIVEPTGGCGRWHYDNITRDKWEKIKELYKKLTGKDLPGYEGTVEIHNPIYLKVYYKYDPDNLTLEIEILEKTWYIFCSAIKNIVDEFLRN